MENFVEIVFIYIIFFIILNFIVVFTLKRFRIDWLYFIIKIIFTSKPFNLFNSNLVIFFIYFNWVFKILFILLNQGCEFTIIGRLSRKNFRRNQTLTEINRCNSLFHIFSLFCKWTSFYSLERIVQRDWVSFLNLLFIFLFLILIFVLLVIHCVSILFNWNLRGYFL